MVATVTVPDPGEEGHRRRLEAAFAELYHEFAYAVAAGKAGRDPGEWIEWAADKHKVRTEDLARYIRDEAEEDPELEALEPADTRDGGVPLRESRSLEWLRRQEQERMGG